MSNSPELTLEELAGTQEQIETIENVAAAQTENINVVSPMLEKIVNIVKMETGDGSIEMYVDHPLNFKKSKGFAQVLRGLTGIIGNLKLAVIDIGLGILNMRGDRNNVSNTNISDNIYKGNGGY